MEREPYLTPDEAAVHLRVSRATFYRLAKREGFPVRYVGSRMRFLVSELDEWTRRPGPQRLAPSASAAPYMPAPVAASTRPAPRRRGRVSVAHLLD